MNINEPIKFFKLIIHQWHERKLKLFQVFHDYIFTNFFFDPSSTDKEKENYCNKLMSDEGHCHHSKQLKSGSHTNQDNDTVEVDYMTTSTSTTGRSNKDNEISLCSLCMPEQTSKSYLQTPSFHALDQSFHPESESSCTQRSICLQKKSPDYHFTESCQARI